MLNACIYVKKNVEIFMHNIWNITIMQFLTAIVFLHIIINETNKTHLLIKDHFLQLEHLTLELYASYTLQKKTEPEG